MIAARDSHTLVLAWGNSGRLDDGLGPAFAAAFAETPRPGVRVLCDYQVQVEHAWDIAQVKRVVFVDASRNGPEPFSFEPVVAAGTVVRFSSHALSPEAALTLARDLFERTPEAWLLGIRGYEFDGFGEGLSPAARRNLEHALRYLDEVLDCGRLEPLRTKRHANTPTTPALR